jgi:hypothetical protein
MNLVRKQGARAAERFDLFTAAQRLLAGGERARLAGALRGKLQRQMDLEDTDSARHAQLASYLNQIEGALA